MKLKIAFVYDSTYPYFIGGAEIRNYQLARQLSSLGHSVHLFGAKMWDGQDVMEKDGLTYHGVCDYGSFKGVRSVWQPLGFSLRLLFALRKERYDLIDCSAFPYLPAYSCRAAASLWDVPLILTWNQYWGRYWIRYKGLVIGGTGMVLEYFARHLTSHHVAVSRKVKDALGVKDAEVIGNGVDIQSCNEAQESREKSDIIFVGRLSHGKNVDVLLRAVSLIPDKPKTMIVGDGPMMGELQRLARSLGLEDAVRFAGETGHEKIFSYLKASKVFAFPSTNEGFGIAAAEAKAAGLVLVVAKDSASAASELVDDGVDGFLVGCEAGEFADALGRLLADERLRTAMSERGKSAALRLTWGAQAKRLEEYYLRVLAGD